jgi:hypothetical protein
MAGDRRVIIVEGRNLQQEATLFSVQFQSFTTKDSTLHNHRYENLKSFSVVSLNNTKIHHNDLVCLNGYQQGQTYSTRPGSGHSSHENTKCRFPELKDVTLSQKYIYKTHSDTEVLLRTEGTQRK